MTTPPPTPLAVRPRRRPVRGLYRVTCDLTGYEYRRLLERRVQAGASVASLVRAWVQEHLGVDRNGERPVVPVVPGALGALAQTYQEHRKIVGRRRRLTAAALRELVDQHAGTDLLLTLCRDYGGSRVPSLFAMVAYLRREQIIREYKEGCFSMRQLAARWHITSKYLRELLRPHRIILPRRKRRPGTPRRVSNLKVVQLL